MSTYQLSEDQLSELKGRAFLAGIAVGIVISAVLFVILSALTMSITVFWHAEAVEHNAAHYDTKTGAFTWNEPAKSTEVAK